MSFCEPDYRIGLVEVLIKAYLVRAPITLSLNVVLGRTNLALRRCQLLAQDARQYNNGLRTEKGFAAVVN
jgi:hypothetical protein